MSVVFVYLSRCSGLSQLHLLPNACHHCREMCVNGSGRKRGKIREERRGSKREKESNQRDQLNEGKVMKRRESKPGQRKMEQCEKWDEDTETEINCSQSPFLYRAQLSAFHFYNFFVHCCHLIATYISWFSFGLSLSTYFSLSTSFVNHWIHYFMTDKKIPTHSRTNAKLAEHRTKI